MEIIKRQISLEDFKSHQHSFIPFIGIDYDGMGKPIFPTHGNWGEIPYDIDICHCRDYETLKTYFGYREEDTEARVSFRELVKKYRILKNVIDNAVYYEKISKGGEENVNVFYPNLSEKYHINIILPDEDTDSNVFGVFNDTTFIDNGGLLMLNFIFRAFGMFIVDGKYVGNNYVPEIMYYTEIQDYLNKLRILQKGEGCCVVEEFEMYGGNDFLNYLGGKLHEIKTEVDYWAKSLYLINGEPVSPEMSLTLSLKSDFYNIGIYTVTDEESGGESSWVKNEEYHTREQSKLKYLRHSKVSYCEKIDENGVVINYKEELPVILIEKNNGEGFIVETPYKVGYPKNISTEIEGDEIINYGDMIYRITNGETSDVIDYVIGGRIVEENGIWRYADDNLDEYYSGVRYSEVVPFEYQDYSNNLTLRYPMIKDGIEVNAFKYPDLMTNASHVKVYNITDDAMTDVKFWLDEPSDKMNNLVIMEDYNFGRTEAIVENVDDIVIDRGYVSAFELHYKMGEINTMDDIVNYSNNIFGL